MQRGNEVTFMVSICEGLYVDGGLCGAVEVPAIAQPFAGETMLKDERRMEANPVFDLGSFDLKVDFESTVSASGDAISARVKLDLPWFCGRDPALRATLYRD